MTPLRRLARDRRGVSAVEFALVVMPFMLMLFGVVEFGRLAWARNVLQQLASETARCMAIAAPDCADPTSKAFSETQTRTSVAANAAAMAQPAPTAVLTRAATCSGVGGFAQATLSINFATVVPGLLKALAGGTALSATACYPNQP